MIECYTMLTFIWEGLLFDIVFKFSMIMWSCCLRTIYLLTLMLQIFGPAPLIIF